MRFLSLWFRETLNDSVSSVGETSWSRLPPVGETSRSRWLPPELDVMRIGTGMSLLPGKHQNTHRLQGPEHKAFRRRCAGSTSGVHLSSVVRVRLHPIGLGSIETRRSLLPGGVETGRSLLQGGIEIRRAYRQFPFSAGSAAIASNRAMDSAYPLSMRAARSSSVSSLM